MSRVLPHPHLFMPFDATKPADHAQIVAAELRNQFNGLQSQITALQQQLSPLLPVFSFDSAAGLWSVTFPGPALAQWILWKRCNYAPNWTEHDQIDATMFPLHTNQVLAGNETWWQVKLVGADDDSHPITPESNVISSPGVPA